MIPKSLYKPELLEQLKKIIASKQVNEELYSQMDGNNTQSAVDVAGESERMIDSFVNQYKDAVEVAAFRDQMKRICELAGINYELKKRIWWEKHHQLIDKRD
mgnify:CR=1 FL=1